MNKEKIVSCFNAGPACVSGWRCTNFQEYQVTLNDNQCIDLPESVAKLLVRDFPHVRILSNDEGVRSISEDEESEVKAKFDEKIASDLREPEVPEELTPQEKFEADLKGKEKYECSTCYATFDKVKGLRMHQMVKHTDKKKV